MRAYTVLPSSASSVLLRPWFIVLVLAGAVERLSGVSLGVAIERDWVVLVFPFQDFLFFSFMYLTILKCCHILTLSCFHFWTVSWN